MKRLIQGFIVCMSMFFGVAFAGNGCTGHWLNPFTDVCWNCLFPMTLGSATLFGGAAPDTKNPSSPVCVCKPDGPMKPPKIGLSVGYWEPVRLSEVVRHPYCFPTMGGDLLGMSHSIVGAGGSDEGANTVGSADRHSFYNVHWFKYPLLTWLGIIDNTLCAEDTGFDVVAITELDPTWRDESLSVLLNPEAFLVNSPPAQAACALDCEEATRKLPRDDLFWCAGCHGNMYPLTGTVTAHIGGVEAAALLTERFNFKLHRMGLEPGTMGKQALCGTYQMPVMQKSQYRLQMTYPKAETHPKRACDPYGRSTMLWESGKEYPKKGEDFAYLIFRKRNCCSFST